MTRGDLAARGLLTVELDHGGRARSPRPAIRHRPPRRASGTRGRRDEEVLSLTSWDTSGTFPGTTCTRDLEETLDLLGFWEAGDGSRTHDLQLGKLTLYQLSYARVEGQLNGSCLGLVGLAHMTGEGGSGS